jgi:hypothetical protein
MSQKYEKLKTLLKELFQLDQPDLDFGLYRIMHAKSSEVTQFLDKELLPQVKEAFGLYKTADKAELTQELAKAIEQAQSLGADPETLPKVQDLHARLKSDAVDIGALENEVDDHLYSFFRRYYSEGDFLAKRVYKPGVYAIPYEGEEVKLHWANRDQYYIKTSEYLRDYAFRLRPDDDKKPMRVHCRLVDAAEGEHGNVKATEGKDRVFLLADPGESGRDFLAEEDGELSIHFEYRPATLADWPEDVRDGKTRPPAQKDLITLVTRRVLAVADASLAEWITELVRPHVTVNGEKADYTRLEAHLRRYTARNTFDYFIHKDLGAFLRRELDFYIKNEVMHLDDVENETAPRVEQYLSKIKVIRRIAGKIIDFLAQLEDFQKKLWLKKKFVVETRHTDIQQSLLDAPAAQGADGLKEQYLLRYMLDVETRGSQSLLNVQAFKDPTAYKLKVKRPGSDESREVNVDLLETFNWLIGLTVQHIAAPLRFTAEFERDSEKRLRLKGQIKQDAAGLWWFRTVTGVTPDGRRTLVIWRKLTGNPEQDNLVLDEWFTKQGYSTKDHEFQLIYVNGGNNLENLKVLDDTWKVRLIEEDFHRLMFDTESV